MKWICGMLLMLALALPTACAEEVKNGIVFSELGMFAGWPANEGFWMWGDEVLVGFEVAKFVDDPDTHNVDRDSPKRIVFARSKDGGETWTKEEHPEIAPPSYLENPSQHVQTHPGLKEPVPCPGGIDFSHPDFAMKLRGGIFYTSTDRGHSWQGPYQLPDFGQELLMARTRYIVRDKDTCQIFVSSSDAKTAAERGRTFMAETRDGGKTFEFVAWVAPDTYDLLAEDERDKPSFSIMPTVAELSDGTMLAGMRQRANRKKWIDIYASNDNGRSWNFMSDLGKGSANPVALVNVGDDRIVGVYGWRDSPFGVRAQISEDGGKTWSPQIVLRDDAYEWDLGYVQAGLRPDGKILAVYYYTTPEMKEQHIASTIWEVPAKDDPRLQPNATSYRWQADGDKNLTAENEGSPKGILLGAQNPAINHEQHDFKISGKFTVPTNDGPNRTIIENIHGLGGYSVIVGAKDRSYHGQLVFNMNGPNPGDDISARSDTRVDDNKPHVFEIVVKDNNVRMMIDGEQQSQTAQCGPGTTASAPDGISAFIGRGFTGQIDELAIQRGSF